LVQLGRTDAIVAMIIIGREITISALREWMAKIGASKSVAVSMLGKIKTAAQMLALPMLLFYAPLAGYRHEGIRQLADLDCSPVDPVVDGLLPAHGLAGNRQAQCRKVGGQC
jgi:phosphatidylglycerophosphate synthase